MLIGYVSPRTGTATRSAARPWPTSAPTRPSTSTASATTFSTSASRPRHCPSRSRRGHSRRARQPHLPRQSLCEVLARIVAMAQPGIRRHARAQSSVDRDAVPGAEPFPQQQFHAPWRMPLGGARCRCPRSPLPRAGQRERHLPKPPRARGHSSMSSPRHAPSPPVLPNGTDQPATVPCRRSFRRSSMASIRSSLRSRWTS